MATENTMNDQLRAIIETLRQEATHIQVQARMLSEAETQRVKQIQSALPLLEEALTNLGG